MILVAIVQFNTIEIPNPISKLVSCWNTATLEPEQLPPIGIVTTNVPESVTQNMFPTKFIVKVDDKTIRC